MGTVIQLLLVTNQHVRQLDPHPDPDPDWDPVQSQSRSGLDLIQIWSKADPVLVLVTSGHWLDRELICIKGF